MVIKALVKYSPGQYNMEIRDVPEPSPGPGPIGLVSALIAKPAGARVIVIGTGEDELRLKISCDPGMDRTINLSKKDPVKIVQKFVGPDGVNVFLECSGAEEAVGMRVNLLRRQGKYTQISFFKEIKIKSEAPIDNR